MYYSIRLLMLVFINKFNGFRYIIKNHTKVTNLEIFLLGFLCLLSILTGYFFKDMFTGFGSAYFNNVIYSISNTWANVELEFIPARIKLTPVITGLVSFIIAITLSQSAKTTIYTSQIKTYFENCKWFYNELVNIYLVSPTFNIARVSFEQYEKRTLEYHGPMFLVNTIKKYVL
jgi:NADH:ubiquinone oxidoreductase subunit 5 (subunit L)/multisubunit Na+/H+ antiporter MnhA subunit